MIEGKGEQGTLEWRREKMGVPSASMFHKIVTPKGILSRGKTTRKYRADLLFEWLTGEPADVGSSGFMDRGSKLEGEARADYAFKRNVAVREVGFCTTNDRRYGCSPDGLIGKDGCLELKCKGGGNHVLALLQDDPDEYRPQVQGQLLVLEREWNDRVFWHPNIKDVPFRFTRDEPFIKTLSAALDEFCDILADERDRLIALGCKPVEIKATGLRCAIKREDGRPCWSVDDVVDVNGLPQCKKHRDMIAAGALGMTKAALDDATSELAEEERINRDICNREGSL